MPLIRPFTGLRPASCHAAKVIAPPYDVLSSTEARQRAKGNPWSFLHISKPEIDLPEGTDPYTDAVYAKGMENFSKLIKEGILQRDSDTYYYIYRLIMGTHCQSGIVAAASIQDYDTNHIRKHEFTHPDKEDDRVRQISTINAQTGPVFLTYRHNTTVVLILENIMRQAPDVDITADDGVQHTLWTVRDSRKRNAITTEFERIDNLYIADGHHRSAAASRVAANRRAVNPKHHGEEAYNYFLTVIFPDDQVKILDYNRVVKDLNGLSQNEFIKRLEATFTVKCETTAVKPGRAGEFGLYLKNQWCRLNIKAEHVPAHDPVKRLDVSLLQDNLFSPLLGIKDRRDDKRVDFVGGIRGLKELERRVDSGEMACAFSLYPTSIRDMMVVADAGKVMPPKSTWFEPKLADGLVTHVLD